MMDEFVVIRIVMLHKSVPSIDMRDVMNRIGKDVHRKRKIGVFCVSYCVYADELESLRMCAVDLSVCPLAASSAFRWMSYLLQVGIEFMSGNYLLPRYACTAALHVRAPSSDSAHSTSARPMTSSSSIRNFASFVGVAGGQRKSPQSASGSVGASAKVRSCPSTEVINSFVIVQPFYQPELSRVPHGQFFSNCREHNITFDFEGKCGVLFQLVVYLIAGAVEFVAKERLAQLVARTATRALEMVDEKRTTTQISSTLFCSHSFTSISIF
ncbi:uncharacterized protein MONOS_9002 [Monocercomonoides exilis]|uniref:uncharacterized protein n=1 Tax=Monocercomonoides exilis TaxID=2049356 RepID=UPI00355A0C7C|nr:hypothetical protein MONOS_9002 [Monocercomonoides exilis]|eukprot:MONOS_9002.1-p1 / transcript=MONOS_9002.1 / gene=MONOS_9002 / organism=Monocercomonoides_exilis_PA203 / gene_product=unspecified product / transcript_product=unspecified product / location=Mono_scaffold00356:59081-59887(-) / protein_length=269 / sequence_SO=supercontig / SO=protein_coding / is_pseudo=false